MHSETLLLQKSIAPSPLMPLPDPWLKKQAVEVWVKRDDLLHPVISGNKWRKLKYCMDQAFEISASCWVSMGGAYSNHLHALAYLGKTAGIQTKGFIRGERPAELNPTLNDLSNWGMHLEFITRSAYRNLRLIQRSDEIPGFKPGHYWIPEGGAVKAALQGVAEILAEIAIDFDCFCLPCGTGTTLAGLLLALPTESQLLGFAALKGKGFLARDIKALLHQEDVIPATKWEIQHDYHFGGFASVSTELMAFIDQFEQLNNVPLEPVYTGKMFYGIYDLIKRRYFLPGQRIIALHTGGLQGNRGFKCREY